MLALFGCNGKKDTAAKNEAKPTGAVLAEVSGTNITVDSFKKEIDSLPPYLKPMADSADGKKEMLETMIIRELILQDAAKDGIENTPAVKEKLDELKKRLVVEAYLKKKVEEQSKVSDDEMKKFYDQNKDKFKTADQVKASHILVKSDKEANDVLAQLKAGGNFEELAKKLSTDGAAAKGGDLGWFSKGSMIPEFEKVAFAMKEGETSGIVKTKFGYHIIKLTGKRAAGQRTFEEVKDQIKTAILPGKQQEVFQKLKDDLKKSGKFTIKEDVLKGLGGTPAEPKGEAKAVPAQPPAPAAAPKAQEPKK
ncbi:MAG TPA: peptidylprolyl isomerase [Geobacteraceae bacterium]|nr:peptidylprolyl isomerase [Geobacteraceae bacterium]